MPRGKGTFRQSDVSRALRAAKAAGLGVVGYEIDTATGKIVVTIGAKPQKETPEVALARWRASRAGKS
jgi:hypothetical protein